MNTSSLTPKGYQSRLIEKRLDALMSAFGCVEITGPKWCGKTWTAMSRCESMTTLDVSSEREVAELDANLALVGESPHLVDEWQEVPSVWDAARRFVDASGNQRGMLVLTGSTALKKDRREEVRHSGAGRIARLEMLPMTLCEMEDAFPKVSLDSLFKCEKIDACRCDTSLEDVARWCCRGGWPANLGMEDEVALETANQYIKSVTDVNVVEEGRSPETALALLRALAMNVSQAVTLKTLSADMGFREGAPDVDTIRAYLDLFSRLKLVVDLPGWGPPMRSKLRVRTKPKHYFCDPSLPAALLGAHPQRLLKDGQTLGLLFENLVLRELSVFLTSYSGVGNRVTYFRDERGLEVDFIVERGDVWGAIEVKLSDTKVDEGAANLLKFKERLQANAAARTPAPAFLAVVVGRGNMAYTRPDGVNVIPVALLGP